MARIPSRINAPDALTSIALSEPQDRSPAQHSSSRREKIAYIEQFRAIAIIMIVIGHCYEVAWSHFIDQSPLKSSSISNMLPALITGGTAYFVFISGFLYRHVFYDRVPYGDFMRKKLLHVGLPYLFFAVPIAIYQIVAANFHVTMFKHGEVYGQSLFLDIMSQLTTGTMMTAYWYIPFVFIVFLASPLFDRFIRLSLSWKLVILFLSAMVAIWVNRPWHSLNPVHSTVYFTTFYLFGIVFCENRAAIMNVIRRIDVIALLVAAMLAVALAQAMLLQNVGNIERISTDLTAPQGPDLMLIQKYLGILLACGALARLSPSSGFLTYVAGISFGLFFVHGPVLSVLMHLPVSLSPHAGIPLLDLAFYGIFVLAVSTIIVVAIKRLSGRYSRYIIGS